MTSSSPLKQVLQNSGILLSGNMLANLFGLISVGIFTKSQGTIIFGYYVLFEVFLNIIERIFNLQSWQAFIKFSTDFRIKNEQHNIIKLLKYSFLVDLLSLMLATIIALFLSSFVMYYFNIPFEYYKLLLLLCLTILFKTTEISTGVFRLFDKFKIQAKIGVYGSAAKLIMFGLISLLCPSFEMFIYAIVLTQFFIMVIKYFYCMKVLRDNNITLVELLKERVDKPLFKELKIFHFIFYNNFDVSVRMVSRQLDSLILGRLYGTEIVGVYKISKEFANLISKLTDPVYQAVYPEFAKLLAEGRKSDSKKMAIKISLYAGSVGLGFYLLFALLGEWAIRLAFGSEFLAAYNITLVYFIAVFIAIVTLPIVPLVYSKGLAKQSFWNMLIATAIYCIIIYPLVLNFSEIGAALAYIAFYIVWMLLALKTIKMSKVFS